MSENYKKVDAAVKFEGGQDANKPKSNAKYREKCNFDTPRNSKLNKNHLYCARLIKAVLVIANLVINLPIILING